MRSFLRRLFHDHRDDVIVDLRNERDYLRSQLEKTEKVILSLTNLHAFRTVHKEVESLPPEAPIPNVLGLRDTEVFRPDYSLRDKQKAFEDEDA